MQKNFFIKTFGCQMNEYDSNRISDLVKKIGYKKTEILESWGILGSRFSEDLIKVLVRFKTLKLGINKLFY